MDLGLHDNARGELHRRPRRDVEMGGGLESDMVFAWACTIGQWGGMKKRANARFMQVKRAIPGSELASPWRTTCPCRWHGECCKSGYQAYMEMA